MELALAALPGVITSCLLAWVLSLVLERQNEERQAHRIEVDRLATVHADQVAGLLQRIQAPQVAVSEHAATHFPPDPIHPDLDDDDALMEIRKRERQLLDIGMIE